MSASVWNPNNSLFSAPNLLRVAATENISELPDADSRKGYLLGFHPVTGDRMLYPPPTDSAAALASNLAGPDGDTLIGTRKSFIGAVQRTQSSLNEQSVHIKDFSDTVGTGIADDTAAFTAAIAHLVSTGGGTLELEGGKVYLLNGGTASPDGYKNGIYIPLGSLNANPAEGITIEGNGARLICGSNNMVLIRNSRNCTTLRNMTLDYNGKTGVMLCLTGPADMTQTTTLVSNSFLTTENVNRLGGPGVDGLVFMPGPTVAGADSGCFYHNISGGYSNFISGGRHIWARKSPTWAAAPNYITRSNFIGQRLTRGNVGYHFEDGSECAFIGCNEESINSGITPIATPTARVFEAPCTAMQFFGGYSEACTASVSVVSSDTIESWGYKPVSGSDSAWRTHAASWADGISDNRPWVPVVNSSGGGAQGASASFGRLVKQGKLVFVVAQISVAKGTLAAGTISISGMPFIADSSWLSADFQGIPITKWSGITLGANFTSLAAYISGATISIRKLHAAGAGTALLTVAECADPIEFTIQGWIKVA